MAPLWVFSDKSADNFQFFFSSNNAAQPLFQTENGNIKSIQTSRRTQDRAAVQRTPTDAHFLKI